MLLRASLRSHVRQRSWPSLSSFTHPLSPSSSTPSFNNNGNHQYFASVASHIYKNKARPTAIPHEIVPGATGSFRTGLLAMKAGMTAEFDEWGVRHSLTVLAVEDCQVVQTKSWEEIQPSGEVKKRYQIQVGAGYRKEKHTTKPLQGHFKRAGIEYKRYLTEFPITEDAVLPNGTEITARHFVPGQLVDVVGTSIGKGFQGGMKRHGFAGQSASHGASKSHRSIGSTGGCQDPGKVFKGKKMAGRMGGKRVTQQSLKVYKIDTKRNLIFVQGSVPGNKGSTVKISDTKKWWKRGQQKMLAGLPFPTFFEEDGKNVSGKSWKNDVLVVPPPELDPLDYSVN
jgi:large subunit ribosomal protein L3